MAYQTRQRDPLLDSSMQEAIEKRGRELIGLALLGLALAIGGMLASYAPQDPSFFSATDAPVQNMLGKFGASVASPLFIVVGYGSWALAAITLAWGARLLMHFGSERAISRVIFAPIAIAAAAVFASSIAPTDAWPHSFGLGGLFGDTVLGAVLNMLPISASFGVRLLSVPILFFAIGMLLFVCGFTGDELRRLGRYILVGVILTYAALLRVFGAGLNGAGKAARGVAEKTGERRARRAEARAVASARTVPDDDDFALTEEPDLDRSIAPEPSFSRSTGGLLASVSTLVRRQPEPELVEAAADPETAEALEGVEAPTEDRIKARIADAIRLRARGGAVRAQPSVGRAEPPVVRRRKPDPLILKVPGAVPPAPMAEIDDMPPVPVPALKHPLSAPRTQPEPEAIESMGNESVVAPSMAGPQVAPRIPQRVVPGMVEESRPMVQHPDRSAPKPSKKAQAEAQPALALEPQETAKYEHPPLSLLTSPVAIQRHVLSDEALEENARMLENVLDDYGVKGEIVSVRPGPVVTMYELEPAPGLKASRVIGLADDIARSMSALSARVSTVPGRSVIGIELPNAHREKVLLREIFAAREFGDTSMPLPLALGKDIGGASVVANLAKMPHLLIAGTTGSGKSVAINTMILSLLYRLSPEECRLIMIDPKMLELSVYDGIPHLLSPVVTDPKKAVVALKWVVGEMEDRYRKMSKMGVRNIEGFNGRVRDALEKGEMFSRTVQTGFDDETGEPVFETEEFAPELLPFIVVVVDEMADLMMVAGKEIEACIQRLAQMARASGIHLIMATQRPSVDVITGTIKANFPTRISFQVTSKIDSRTILGEMGAEQLLGMGDMLYMAGGSKVTRVHGPFVSDEEVEEIVNHLKSFGPPEYIGGVVDGPDDDKESDIDLVLGLGGNTDSEDALYDQAVAIVIKDRKCSTSYIQRKLAIGYNKAARLVEQMEDEGLVSASNHVGKREILVPEQG
ncbi:FtsK/SpoIIIE family DNA translocase [Aliiruegeria lutimaris]|uniref:DNA translocase FtsK n=1 Tax=Aliiruegeria lutimaris TaxID=571298 RepID=A0A1G8MBM6_9RHOB|nr:DNA translocase FtsK 4TM domain-containing protein [Aliiruegeria lutimaris]SDI65344.1 DNA segregation ATPase FtsK/SpoIIIE, S-DNA-T family [Aliiruegeria lutimaris]